MHICTFLKILKEYISNQKITVQNTIIILPCFVNDLKKTVFLFISFFLPRDLKKKHRRCDEFAKVQNFKDTKKDVSDEH